MAYAEAAVERAVKVHEVLMQALNGRQPWIQVAEVLGVSARTVRRLRLRYEARGFDGLTITGAARPRRARSRSPRCSASWLSIAIATARAMATPASTCATSITSHGATTASPCPT